MDIRGKKVLVMGLGISGIASIKALSDLGARVLVTDSKGKKELKDQMLELADLNVEYYLGESKVDLVGVDLILKSPGIPYDLPILLKARQAGIEVITDIELAYRIARAEFIAITGTNGKTTTTTLVGQIFKRQSPKSHVVGNIGVGVLSKLRELDDGEAIFILEASSFQLEDTSQFRPKIALITNITPDHINWHNTFENYIESKKKIFKNQVNTDFTVLNYEDHTLREAAKEAGGKVIFFSSKRPLKEGVYLEDGAIWISSSGEKIRLMDIASIRVPGTHNLENVLSAIAVAFVYGVDLEIIKEVVSNFEGVEHRLEFVSCIDGISFYNDSKGTNPDASIKAIKAIEEPITLIAGGMDKGGEFEDFVDSFENKVKNIILLGETADKIATICKKKGYENVFKVRDMQEAVRLSFEVSHRGSKVLLSPACASWDMYESYEVRGEEFKRAVNRLGEV